MNYAHIVDGVVSNIVVADAEWVEQQTDVYVELSDVVRADMGQEYVAGAFLPMKPYPSWTRNTDKSWSPPVAYPSNDYALYKWNEENLSWVVIQDLQDEE